jgi:O-6-methylguanine DNA methyltransferase
MARGQVAWDVPVRLVPLVAPLAPRTPRVSVRVDPGVPLPGVVALEATTVTVDDGPLLERLAPVAAASDRPASAADGASVPLEDLLAQLRNDGAVPVAVAGTSFMLAVLEALTRVPAGTTCTYAELAAAAGRPAAVRAAATVMANNRVPLVLPCHRVVPASGGTGRYGWGPEAKAALLAAEVAP